MATMNTFTVIDGAAEYPTLLPDPKWNLPPEIGEATLDWKPDGWDSSRAKCFMTKEQIDSFAPEVRSQSRPVKIKITAASVPELSADNSWETGAVWYFLRATVLQTGISKTIYAVEWATEQLWWKGIPTSTAKNILDDTKTIILDGLADIPDPVPEGYIADWGAVTPWKEIAQTVIDTISSSGGTHPIPKAAWSLGDFNAAPAWNPFNFVLEYVPATYAIQRLLFPLGGVPYYDLAANTITLKRVAETAGNVTSMDTLSAYASHGSRPGRLEVGPAVIPEKVITVFPSLPCFSNEGEFVDSPQGLQGVARSTPSVPGETVVGYGDGNTSAATENPASASVLLLDAKKSQAVEGLLEIIHIGDHFALSGEVQSLKAYKDSEDLGDIAREISEGYYGRIGVEHTANEYPGLVSFTNLRTLGTMIRFLSITMGYGGCTTYIETHGHIKPPCDDDKDRGWQMPKHPNINWLSGETRVYKRPDGTVDIGKDRLLECQSSSSSSSSSCSSSSTSSSSVSSSSTSSESQSSSSNSNSSSSSSSSALPPNESGCEDCEGDGWRLDFVLADGRTIDEAEALAEAMLLQFLVDECTYGIGAADTCNVQAFAVLNDDGFSVPFFTYIIQFCWKCTPGQSSSSSSTSSDDGGDCPPGLTKLEVVLAELVCEGNGSLTYDTECICVTLCN